MMTTVLEARRLARDLVGDLHPRWEHLRAVGESAERLCEAHGLPERVAVAAWLHDIGYSPEIARTGFHPLDGARFLAERETPVDVVRLVAWHTGAGFEAAQRGLLDELDDFAEPVPAELDALTMVDLATSPTGEPIVDADRIAEILSRYEEGHPVHEAVTASRPHLLAASARAKVALGLPDNWPLGHC